MRNIVEFMVELTDIQKEIHMKIVRKYPRANTNGGFNDLIASRNLKLNGAKGLLYYPKDISFSKAIDNLLYNLDKLNQLLKLTPSEYETFKNKITNIKNELNEAESLDILLELDVKRRVPYESFEYEFANLKHFYDSLMYIDDIKIRHERFYSYYEKSTIGNVLTIKEACEKYDFNIDTFRRFLNRGANGLLENIDYKKSGGTWLLTKGGIEKYKNIKK